MHSFKDFAVRQKREREFAARIVIQPMIEQIGRTAAEHVSPRQRGDGVVMVVGREKQRLRRRILPNENGCRGIRGRKEPYGVFPRTRNILSCKRKDRRVRTQHDQQKQRGCTYGARAELLRRSYDEIGAQDTEQRVGDIQQLVVVIYVRLKNSELTKEKQKRRRQKDGALFFISDYI